MSDLDACSLSIARLAEAYRKQALSPVEVTRAALARIDRLEQRYSAFLLITADRAMEDARRAEARLSRGEASSPLCGVPVTIKDNFDVEGLPMTCGSNVLKDRYVSSDYAEVTRRLLDAGAVLLGKTNLMEFACGDTYPEYTATRNPWNLERSTGGSSSGSAATVAARQAFASLGTDTGGSVRNPASYCGLVGLKPSYGLLSRHGVVPTAWTCDHVGVLARTAIDAALVMAEISGHDPKDPTSAARPTPEFLKAVETPVDGLRLGVVRREFTEAVEPEVRDAALEAVDVLGNLGMRITEVDLPFEQAVVAWTTIFLVEASAYHRTWLRLYPEGYSRRVRMRLKLGALIPAVDYVHAQRVRREFSDRVNQAFERVDVLVTPTTPTPAQRFQERAQSHISEYVRKSSPFNLSGHPAVSVPCGFSSAGLPIGLQIVGRMWADDTILRIAGAYQQATGWHERRPADV